METNQLEKELQVWHHFMYVALGASTSLLIIGFGNYIHGNTWPRFENYASGLWQWMQIATTSLGFYLLRSKQWKGMQFSRRKNTITGFFVASGINFLSLGFITANSSLILFAVSIFVCAGLVALGYLWTVKKNSKQSDEMFP